MHDAVANMNKTLLHIDGKGKPFQRVIGLYMQEAGFGFLSTLKLEVICMQCKMTSEIACSLFDPKNR